MSIKKKPTTCPDCGQKLSEPQRPCGYLGGEPVWCAYCESDDRKQEHDHGGKRAGAGRPVTGNARVTKSFRLDREAARRIDAFAKRLGKSQGDVVSELGLSLPAE